jgi:hypothetical protein
MSAFKSRLKIVPKRFPSRTVNFGRVKCPARAEIGQLADAPRRRLLDLNATNAQI